MNEDEYLGGLDPIPTKRPVDQRDNQPYRPSPPSVDARELAAIRAEVQRLQRDRDKWPNLGQVLDETFERWRRQTGG